MNRLHHEDALPAAIIVGQGLGPLLDEGSRHLALARTYETILAALRAQDAQREQGPKPLNPGK